MQTQSAGQISPKSIDFSHRLFNATGEKPDVINSVEDIAIRAESVIRTIMALCTAGQDSQGLAAISRVDPDTIYFSLESACKDIQDITNILIACGDAKVAEPRQFVEVAYWADNHLLAADNRYRLIENGTKALLVEFEAETLAEAEVKSSRFIRHGSINEPAGKDGAI